MSDLLSTSLLILAFVVLVGTLLVTTRLHRARSLRLPSIGQGAPGKPLRLGWPIVDWIIRIHEIVPGYYKPIGVVYGLILGAVACTLLFLSNYVASTFGVVMSYVGASYCLEGISHALKRKDHARTLVAATGIALGYSVFALQIAALFGRRLLPAWSL